VTSVATLAMPFFGLIFLGFVCGKLMKYPEAGLQWMNFFIVYVALPALFFKLIAAAPFEQLANWPFVIGTTLSTYVAFTLAFVLGLVVTGGRIREATIQGVVGSYANIGYMGPGLTIAAPLVYALAIGDSIRAFALPLAIAIVLFVGALRLGRRIPAPTRRESLLAAVLTWVGLSLFGILPYVLGSAAGGAGSPIDAFFESTAGFTATGSTVITELQAQSRPLMLWRAQTQWIGGIGLIIGPAGLFWLNLKRHPDHGDVSTRPMDRAFIALLGLCGASGMALLAARSGPAMPLTLAIHLGAVMAFFLTLPYGKFAHAPYRVAALLKFAVEKRMPSRLRLGSD
jgi:hypothetical protein